MVLTYNDRRRIMMGIIGRRRVSGGGELWTPAEISTVVWFDASDTGTLWADTGATTPATTSVARWDDKSGNTNHATQGTGSLQPVTGSATIGGLNAIRGVDGMQFMDVTNTPTVQSVFGVFNVSVNPGDLRNIINLGGNGSSPNSEVFVRYGGPQVSCDGQGSAQGKYSLNGGADSGYAENHTDTGISTGDNVIEVVQQNTLSLSVIIGRNGADVGPTDKCIVGEIVWCSTELDTSDKQKMEGYLAWKWGTESKLPTGHPYENGPPTV